MFVENISVATPPTQGGQTCLDKFQYKLSMLTLIPLTLSGDSGGGGGDPPCIIDGNYRVITLF